MKILEHFISSPLAGAIGWTLLHSLWEGAAISAILGAVLLATRSPRLHYAAACAALIGIVAAFGVTLFRLLPESTGNFPRFRTVVPFITAGSVAPQGDNARTWLSDLGILAPWLAPFWIVGVLLLSLQRVMSLFAVRKLRTRGVCFASEEWHAHLARMAGQLRISRPVHLLESAFAEIPMVLGHLRPVILMPLGLLANLPAEQVETVLLHELAHVRRCDYLVNVFQRLIESLLFYHPATWWISKIIRSERENCCDDIVISVTLHADKYAEALAALERNRFPRHEAVIAATGGTLVKRIRRLLYPKAPAGIWAPIAAAVILAATAAVSLAAWQPKSAQATIAALRVSAGPALSRGQGRAQTRTLVAETGAARTGPYWKWLDEDVVYIITPAERSDFMQLKTDEQRDLFIKEFWERHNPSPGSAVNTFKDEHYRRIAYANEHFASPSVPGWKTDRGRIYITWGPPDQRDEHTASELSNRPADQGAGAARTYAYEDWRYYQIVRLDGDRAENVEFEFVDPSGTGEFYLTMNPSKKYAEASSSQTEESSNGNSHGTSASAPDATPQLKPLSRAPISIKATEDSRMIYETIASLADVNVEFDPSFTSQRINVNLAGATLEQALDAVSAISRSKWSATAPTRFVVAAAGPQHTSADMAQSGGRISASQPGTTFVAQGNVQVVFTSPYSKWLNEDVVYIITDEERDTFLHLKTDEERQQFITAFWERRNPTPGSADNKFKDEHYRRIAYANQHFGTPSGKAGWQTDRGHIYIVYGPPDRREEFLPGENGSQFATEIWRYNHIEGVGDNLSFEFVSRGVHGDFTLAPAPSSAQAAPQPGVSNASTEPDWNAKHGITILSPTEGVDFQPYINDMLKSVQARWISAMPREVTLGKVAGQVSVIFNIQPDGHVGESHIASGSGVRSLDDAALDAVRGSSPLKPLPIEFHGPYLRLKLTFAYNQPLHG